MTLAAKVLIVAGRGALPGLLADSLGDRALIIAIKDFAQADICARAIAEIQLGHFGTMLQVGRQHGATEVLFAGGLDRPSAEGFSLDDYTKNNMDLSRLYAGDDAILRAIAALFLKGGLKTVGALEVAPELAMDLGVITQSKPAKHQITDRERGLEVARALGALDVGQSVVCQQGLVLAVEGIEGTDALITRSARLARPGVGPVLIKTAKPQQDMRLDIPTFGPQTVERLATHGFSGAFLEAGRTLIIDQDSVARAANQACLFLEGVGA